MGLEVRDSSELPVNKSNNLKNEIKEVKETKETPLEKVGLILADLNSRETSPQDKKIMKQLLLRTQEAGELIGKRIGKEISGKHQETSAFDRHKNRRNLAVQRSTAKEVAEMTVRDKVNVLFGTFSEGLLIRLSQEKVDMKKISDADFDRVYQNVTKEMLNVYIDRKLDDLSKKVKP